MTNPLLNPQMETCDRRRFIIILGGGGGFLHKTRIKKKSFYFHKTG